MCNSGSRTFDGGLWKRRNSGSGNSGDSSPGSRKKSRGFGNYRICRAFSEFKNTMFIFSSGAGAWRTELQIREDGSFSGRFEDANMGEIGEENPQGTIYESVFTGRLGFPVRLDENSYQVDILEMEYENPLETEEIMLL